MSMGVSSLSANAPQEILQAIKTASVKTGVDFDYLVNQARTESGFKADAKAKTSSATGLYQFLDQTWLSTVAKHGAAHGLTAEAAAIQQDFQGRYYVADDTQKSHIMALRKDPQISALMAAEFAADNQSYLENKLGRDTTPTDLYFAHFLGAGGAGKFLSALDNNPDQPAARMLSTAAKANKNVFFNADGSMKTVAQVYDRFAEKFAGEVSPSSSSAPAPVQTAKAEAAVSATAYQPDIAFSRMYGDKVDRFVSRLPSAPALTDNSDLFNTMLRTDNRDKAITPQLARNSSLFLTLTMLDIPT